MERVASRRLDRTAWIRGVEEIDLVLGAVAEARPNRVLDAGCGRGDWAAMVAAPEVICIDQAEAAIDEARRRGLHAQRAAIEALPFEAETFDVVMCNAVLYHLTDVDRGLAELARVLRPGGRFVGVYTRSGHLAELWSAVGRRPARQAFDGDTGGELLAAHFAAVERRDTSGEVLWEAREDVQAYLDAYRELAGPLRAPSGPYPFRASRLPSVFVAVKAV